MPTLDQHECFLGYMHDKCQIKLFFLISMHSAFTWPHDNLIIHILQVLSVDSEINVNDRLK